MATPEIKQTRNYLVVRIVGQDGYFCQTGYSKYNERFTYRYENNYPDGYEIYGIEQAKEHIQELKESVYEGKKHHADKTFEIVRVIETEQILETI